MLIMGQGSDGLHCGDVPDDRFGCRSHGQMCYLVEVCSLSAFLADFLPELKPERSLFLLFQGI